MPLDTGEWPTLLALYVTLMGVPVYVAYVHHDSYRRLAPFVMTGTLLIAGMVGIGRWQFDRGVAYALKAVADKAPDPATTALAFAPEPIYAYGIFGFTFLILALLMGLPSVGLVKGHDDKRESKSQTDR